MVKSKRPVNLNIQKENDSVKIIKKTNESFSEWRSSWTSLKIRL